MAVRGGRRAAGTHRWFSRGVCPVCRGEYSLRPSDGKMMPHGKTAAAPAGCAGNGLAPLRERRQAPGELRVSPITTPASAVAEQPLPDLGIEIRVDRRDDGPRRPGPPPGGVA